MLTVFTQRLWRRAPRRLRFTRAGRGLVAIALAVGLAALNTGNNLLFFGWGMVLCAIIVSGLLSEATLRYLQTTPLTFSALRAGQKGLLKVCLANASRRMPAFALEVMAEGHGPQGAWQCRAPYQLRLAPADTVRLQAIFEPPSRGGYAISTWQVTTAYPFGFFEKSRRLAAGDQRFWCAPRAVEVAPLVRRLTAALGEVPASRVGFGEDFFSLRPFRAGDDWRRINWRRSARTQRLVVVEHEAMAGREVILQLCLRAEAAAVSQEYAISVLGSLAEALLAAGLRVGVRTGPVALQPEAGLRQRQRILAVLARLDVQQATIPALQHGRGATGAVALVGPGAAHPGRAFGGTVLNFEAPTA